MEESVYLSSRIYGKRAALSCVASVLLIRQMSLKLRKPLDITYMHGILNDGIIPSLLLQTYIRMKIKRNAYGILEIRRSRPEMR